MNRKLAQLAFVLTAFLITALQTPWWGTGLLAGIFALMRSNSVKLLTFASFFGWVMAVFIRDGINQQSPSRIFVRLIHESSTESSLTRLFVILLTASIGAIFAAFAAGLVVTLTSFWYSWQGTGTKV